MAPLLKREPFFAGLLVTTRGVFFGLIGLGCGIQLLPQQAHPAQRFMQIFSAPEHAKATGVGIA